MNIYLQLLSNQWKQFRRSASFERELTISIILGILIFMAFLSLIGLGFALPKLLRQIPGVTDPVDFINSILFYYFISEFMIRYFLQKVPVIDIEPYVCLPIKQSAISNFLLLKSVFSPFNLLTIILFGPLTLSVLSNQYSIAGALSWFMSVFLISFSIHFFNILVKKKLDDSLLFWGIIIGLAAVNLVLKTYTSFDVFLPVELFFTALLTTPYLIIVALLILLISLYATFRFLTTNLYLEELNANGSTNMESYSQRLSFLGNSSLENLMMLQEIRLIIRHKRTRSLLIVSLLFTAYGLLFFGKDSIGQSKAMYVFLGIFMTGIFSINYGQFFWSWFTNQLDFYFTRPVSTSTLLRSRFKLLTVGTVITTFICMPYVYFGWDILVTFVACGLYNIGINIPLLIRMAMWGPKPIDLSKSDMFNFSGSGAAQFLMGIPLLALPYLIYIPLNLFLGFYSAMAGIALVGVIGIVLREFYIKLLIKKLRQVKYSFIRDLNT